MAFILLYLLYHFVCLQLKLRRLWAALSLLVRRPELYAVERIARFRFVGRLWARLLKDSARGTRRRRRPRHGFEDYRLRHALPHDSIKQLYAL